MVRLCKRNNGEMCNSVRSQKFPERGGWLFQEASHAGSVRRCLQSDRPARRDTPPSEGKQSRVHLAERTFPRRGSDPWAAHLRTTVRARPRRTYLRTVAPRTALRSCLGAPLSLVK